MTAFTDRFLSDAANGELPAYSFIEPNDVFGHMFPGLHAS